MSGASRLVPTLERVDALGVSGDRPVACARVSSMPSCHSHTLSCHPHTLSCNPHAPSLCAFPQIKRKIAPALLTATLALAADEEGQVTEDRAARLAHLISEMLKSDLVALENLSEVRSFACVVVASRPPPSYANEKRADGRPPPFIWPRPSRTS